MICLILTLLSIVNSKIINDNNTNYKLKIIKRNIDNNIKSDKLNNITYNITDNITYNNVKSNKSKIINDNNTNYKLKIIKRNIDNNIKSDKLNNITYNITDNITYNNVKSNKSKIIKYVTISDDPNNDKNNNNGTSNITLKVINCNRGIYDYYQKICVCNNGYVTYDADIDSYCNYEQKSGTKALILTAILGQVGAGRFYVEDNAYGAMLICLVFSSCCIACYVIYPLILACGYSSEVAEGLIAIYEVLLCVVVLALWITDIVKFAKGEINDGNGVSLSNI
jgi:TM2 domain-containing membrane protein YozV